MLAMTDFLGAIIHYKSLLAEYFSAYLQTSKCQVMHSPKL